MSFCLLEGCNNEVDRPADNRATKAVAVDKDTKR